MADRDEEKYNRNFRNVFGLCSSEKLMMKDQYRLQSAGIEK